MTPSLFQLGLHCNCHKVRNAKTLSPDRSLYHLAFQVNYFVITAAHAWCALASWASLLGISMLERTSTEPLPLRTEEGGFREVWRQKLCSFLTEVVTMQLAVDLISEVYFDGHDVLFIDTKEQLASSYETAKLLIVGYNYFAQENGRKAIDIDSAERCPRHKVDQHLNEWLMFSRSKVLVARGKVFEARDEMLSLLSADKPVEE